MWLWRFAVRSVLGAVLFTLKLSCTANAQHNSRIDVVTQAGHSGGILALALSIDGRLAASAGDDHQIRIWDAGTGLLLRTISNSLEDLPPLVPRSFLAFSPDGRRLLSGNSENALKVLTCLVSSGHA
jgi:WD40 repeat protein